MRIWNELHRLQVFYAKGDIFCTIPAYYDHTVLLINLLYIHVISGAGS